MHTGLTSRLRSAFAEWRLEPWPLRAWGDQTGTYRGSVVGLYVAYPLLTAIVWMTGSLEASIDFTVLGIAVALAVVTSVGMLVRDSSEEIAGIDIVIGLPLLLTGHTLEAIACCVVYNCMHPIRKPLVPHLAVFNLLLCTASMSVAALVIERVGNGAVMPDVRYFVTALVAFVVLEAVQLGGIYVVLVTGTYMPRKEVLPDFFHHVYTSGTTLFLLALLVAPMLTYDKYWMYAFLCVPAVIKYMEWINRDRLVDAEQEASRDALTGLANRREFLRRLDRWERDDGANAETSDWFVFCDLDNFKQLNDTKGHDAGDEALKTAAKEIEASVRDNDTCARFGGEEFVVVLRNTDRAGAAQVAERIRANIEVALGPVGTTVSVGVHRFDPNERVDDALASADIAMYASKTHGKNRVTFSDDAGDFVLPSRSDHRGSASDDGSTDADAA